MKTTIHFAKKLTKVMLLFAFLFSIKMNAQDQEDPGISIYQYKQVTPEQMEEFIARETKYWSKVAENSIAKGNLTFWALLQKVGGFDEPNSSNILFINTLKNIDELDGIWDPSEVWPNVAMDQMETFSMGKAMHSLFVKPAVWVEANNVNPETDFNYVKMIYHNAVNPGNLIELEDKHWGTFIKSSMDNGKTKQKAWGNGMILSPSGPNMKANTISYDIYSSLKEALDPTWDQTTEFPNEGLTEINAMEMDQRTSYVYRIIKVVTPPEQ